MKSRIIYMYVLSCAVFFSCNTQQVPNMRTIISLIYDRTDPFKAMPRPNEILEYYKFSDNPDQEAYFRYRLITDFELNPVYEVRLPGSNETEKLNTTDDNHFREKAIISFFDKVKSKLGDTLNQGTGKSLPFSQIFKTVADEITWMAKMKADKKKLFIFSDGFENSDILDTYSRKVQNKIFDNPQGIIEVFEKTHMLPDTLNNMEIHFIYSPESREADKLFNALVKNVYKKMLQRRGATVIIEAENMYKP